MQSKIFFIEAECKDIYNNVWGFWGFYWCYTTTSVSYSFCKIFCDISYYAVIENKNQKSKLPVVHIVTTIYLS